MKDRNIKTKEENKNIKIILHSLNLDLEYNEVGDLIELIPRYSNLRDLRKDLIKWQATIE